MKGNENCSSAPWFGGIWEIVSGACDGDSKLAALSPNMGFGLVTTFPKILTPPPRVALPTLRSSLSVCHARSLVPTFVLSLLRSSNSNFCPFLTSSDGRPDRLHRTRCAVDFSSIQSLLFAFIARVSKKCGLTNISSAKQGKLNRIRYRSYWFEVLTVNWIK